MKFFWVLCVLGGLGSSAVAIDREAFTFTKYDLEIRLEPEQQRLGARGKITLRNDSAQPQKIAVLQISSSLAWRSVKVSDKAVQFVSQPYVSDIDHTGALSEAIVTLPAEVKPKESVELAIGYEGTVVLDATRLTQIGVPEDIAKHTSWDQISASFTAVRGVGYVAWYPIATEAADFSEGNSMFQVADRWKAREAGADMKINLCAQFAGATAPNLMMNEVPRTEGSGGGYDHHSCTGHHFAPLGSIVPAFVTGDFNKKVVAPGTVPIQIYFLAGRETGASFYATSVEAVAPFISDWFGPPSLPVVIADLADANASSFESGYVLLAPMASGDGQLAAINVAHMLVHSSLYSPRPWIQEGLAHFAEAMYREQKQDGRMAALEFLGLHRATFVDAEKEVVAGAKETPGQPLASTFDESYYRSKAAYVWWMLRDMIGDDALKAAIGRYRAEDDKDPTYVQKLLAAAAPKRDLGWFFDDWVYHDRGLPDLRVLAAHPWKNEKGTQIVTVTIENLGGAGAEVPFAVRFEGGEIAQRIEVRAKSTATTRVEVRGTATEVVVNDGSVPESDLTNNTFKISAP